MTREVNNLDKDDPKPWTTLGFPYLKVGRTFLREIGKHVSIDSSPRLCPGRRAR